MAQPIEVFLQPPSPKMNSTHRLPSMKTLFPLIENNERELPSICLAATDSSNDRRPSNSKLKTIEPQPDLSPSTSPYQSSPVMTFSSPSSTTSSIVGSPLVSPIHDGSFLLPPPDQNHPRHCRSVSNCSSPSVSPYSIFSFRSLSEPPTLNLPSPEGSDKDETSEAMKVEHSIFGPKRKRGRPSNASKPEVQSDSNFTFVKPTVWDVKNNHTNKLQDTTQHQTSSSTTNNSNITISDGINTFTAANMDTALNIPRKKRGRKPKKQLTGNSCFIWKDLTAPRGANKKSLIDKNNNATIVSSGSSSDSGSNSSSRALLPAKKK